MSSLNKIILFGEIVSTVDVKVTTGGHTVANFRLKVDRPKRPDAPSSQSDEIQVVVWRDLAETAKDLTPGAILLVEGRILTRNYEDKSGQRQYVTEVEASELIPAGQGTPAPPLTEDPFAQAGGESLNEMPIEKGADAAFNFDQAVENAAQEEAKVPADFGKQVEEDIPF
ncbi:MAG: single stranded DNA-binding protein [Candidatus Marinamargulisbacteria bacterium]